MRLRVWPSLLYLMAISVAVFGEPKPVALIAAVLSALTATYDWLREIDQ